MNAAEAIEQYAEHNERHIEGYNGLCSVMRGDRCDITAALRHAAKIAKAAEEGDLQYQIVVDMLNEAYETIHRVQELIAAPSQGDIAEVFEAIDEFQIEGGWYLQGKLAIDAVGRLITRTIEEQP